jgi:putative heme-binding domain-containing protein
MNAQRTVLLFLFFAHVPAGHLAAQTQKPLKVFILAGQSNMEGQAVADLDGKDYNGGKGTLNHLLNDPDRAPLVKHLKNARGEWTVRQSVWVRYQPEKGPVKAGPLTLGFTPYPGKHHFGPELQFGHVLGDHYGSQVLLIKTAWGGKSLYTDFRPPSSGGEVGPYYRKMIAEVRKALANLPTDFPAYDGKGYELAGFVWYQGWNDGVDPKHAVPEYEQNLVNLIRDVRKDLNAPNLPVVIGELTGPWVKAPGAWATLRKAQAAAAARPEFKGSVLFVETHDFVRKPEDSPNPGHGHHEFGNAETYILVGQALGNGMRKLLGKAPARPEPQQQPFEEDPAALARAAREQGDPSRGALVFYRSDLACTRCHTAGEDVVRLGPDLARAGKEITDLYLVESILQPSKVVKKGYETIVLTTKAGKTLTGLLAEERTDAVVLRDAAQDGKLITVPKTDIDERSDRGPSLMPEGLVKLLSGRQEFLDLARYLMEIAEKGPERARQLRPAASVFALPPLPDYERHLDHAGLIRSLDGRSVKRGQAIYLRVCVNCHGTREQVGSLPTSLRFADGKFKNGADPYRMYQTLTHGFGMMTPQTWMVPEQKYDVIHYIRETYLKPHNPGQYVAIDDAYLAGLPRGTTRGPKPTNIEPWVSMNYGPSLLATLEVGNRGNFAYKGIAVRLDNGPGGVSRGRHWMLFDHDTLRAVAAWSGEGFIDWNGINFNGRHQIYPRIVGSVSFANPVGPGWANPETGRFDDIRLKGRDGKPYGPLPRSWARYRGLFHYGNQVILSYTVGTAAVLEMPAYELAPGDRVVFTRTLNVGPSPRDLLVRVAPLQTAVALVGDRATLEEKDGYTLLRIPAAATPLAVKLLLADGDGAALRALARTSAPAASLEPFTKGGPPRWPEVLRTQSVVGGDSQAFAIDVLTHPTNNPWNCQMRLTGFDFFADGRRAAVCTWDGDVWQVDGIDDPGRGLTWRRIASGLFQPLGLKIVRDRVHVCCRDQIVILHDLNGDGETDFYECFNNDHQVTEHFHEFAMGLQIDAEGNFYYARAARHALKAVVPHHGTLLRVSKDGTRTDILATGFRAPNGVCVNPDGIFFLTDQEGFWVPKNRIDLVEPGGYHGNFWGYVRRVAA